MSEYPFDWTTSNLGAHLTETKERAGDSDTIPYSVSKVLGIVPQSEKFNKRVASNDTSNYKVIRKGDFAYDPMLLWDGSINRMLRDGKGAVSPAYVTFKVVSSSLDADYLLHLLKASTTKNFYKSISKGTNVRRQKAEFADFAAGEFAFPPLPEQKKIAEILSRIDQWIYEQKNKIDIVNTILENTSSQLLDNISRDPSTHHRRIDEVSTLKGGNGFPIEHQGITHGGTPFIKVSDFNKPGNENEIKTANNYLSKESMSSLRPYIFPVNTIVFAKVGAALTSNRRRILSAPTCIDNNLMGAIPNGIDPLYLKLLFEKIDFNEFCQDGAVPSVNQAQIGRIEVPIPSTDKQKQVVLAIESFRAARKTLEAKKEKLVALKNALSSDLLSGRKRVSI